MKSCIDALPLVAELDEKVWFSSVVHRGDSSFVVMTENIAVSLIGVIFCRDFQN